ncbi:MAG: glycosyltransferase [Ignavibacteriales bacterium]|nr:glycosyltransferase [Ignavibacteriales bacterium]
MLPRAINSVLKQSFPDWELIVIDDGSDDATRTLIDEYINKDGRITYFFQPNAGLASARNTGMQRASGDYLCFLDSDDELAPAHLERRVKYLEKYPSVDFLHGGMTLVGPKKKQYVVDLTDPKKKIHLSECHVGGTFFFHRKVLRRVKTFSAIPFGEDFDFYTRVEKYFTVRKVHYPTYIYHLDVENRLCDVYTEKLMKGKAVGRR